jgi:muconolactone delta-isomerase
MKLLALEHEVDGINPDAYQPHLKAEAHRVWELQQSGILREIYFRQDQSTAVLVLECESVAEAQKVLGSLPLVAAELITFEVIPLKAYPGFERLFGAKGQ